MQPIVVDIGDGGLISGRWHSLVISHRRSSTMLFNKDHLEASLVFLDEERLFASSVPYPRHISEPVAHCSIGWDLDGQMSGVLLISGVAELKVLKSMLSRLAGRIDDIKQDAAACASTPPDLDLWDDTATVSAQQRLKRRLLGSKYRVFAALLPDRTINGLCLEPHNGQHALLRGDTTHVWITRHSQDVVKSIGGTLTVLSLAHELLSDTPQRPPATPIPSPATEQNVDTVLSVLLSFLDGNIANQGDFFFAGGVEILELLLQSAPKKLFAQAGAHTVLVLERIFWACRSHQLSVYIQQALPRLAEDAYRPRAGMHSLEHQILVCLLSNFSLWARAPPEFQFGLVTSVLDMVRGAPELFRQLLPLESVLTSIRVCCPDQIAAETGRPHEEDRNSVSGFMASETTSESSADFSDTNSTTDREWSSMARRERTHMRGFLWEFVRLLLEREVRQQDGEALVHFIASCDDTRLVCELVQMLGSLMRKSVPSSGLFLALEMASLAEGGSGGNGWRPPKVVRTQSSPDTGFVPLVLERCVLVNGTSEELRGAGIRLSNVFMARSAKANGLDASIAGGESMSSKVSSVFPVLSEGLMRHRHSLGGSTYAALLEMALLGDEHDVPWSGQGHVVGIVNANSRFGQRSSSDLEMKERSSPEGASTEDDELARGVWWDYDLRDAGVRGGKGHVLDDTQLIRNVLPLALILQHLPTMASSVQERSHGDLLLMLKLNRANREKVMELSYANKGKFWGIWERCMFLMMAPLFSRRGAADECTGLDRQDEDVRNEKRTGDYLMVLRLYAILLEHAISFDEDGYKEIAVASSLQHLIPHGRKAVRVLLAQLAFEVGQNPDFSLPLLRAESFSDSSSDAGDPEGEQVETPQQPRWNNMVHLAFIAANVVSDDVSTVTLGLFPRGEDAGRGGEQSGDEPSFVGDGEAIRASKASASIPFLLYSSPAGHASLALSARVLGMFGVLSGGASLALLELCTARSVVSGQGPLMFPLLRLSAFLLVHLHPFTRPAHENLQRLASLVQCLLSDGWHSKEGSLSRESDNMCIVVLAHVHAALLRLKTQATTVGGTSYRCVSEARKAVADENFTSSGVSPSAVDASAAYEYGTGLLSLLRYFAIYRRDLLSKRLGEQLWSAIVEATTFEPQDAFGEPESVNADDVLELYSDQARRCWDHLLQSLRWMETTFLFSSTEDSATRASDGVAALLEACMPSLKAAEELENRAVREAGERTRRWRERENRIAVCAHSSKDGLASADGVANKVYDTLRQKALKTRALREVETDCRRLASRRRFKCCLQTLSAAWSPWAAGDHEHGSHNPLGWEVSSHKDQLMRQMLLVPIDEDVSHKDAAYAGMTPSSGDPCQLLSSDDDVHRDARLMSGLKPSASLLSGGSFGFVDDDEEETDGEVEQYDRPPADSFGLRGTEEDSDPDPAEWQDVSRLSASQAEIEAASQSAANQLEWQDIQPSGRVQRLCGQWRATNVLRQGSLPGVLYLFEESLVFKCQLNESEGSEEAAAGWLTQHAGQSWRWRLERLTQLHLRRFLLSPQAVELFWADSPEVFLAFEDTSERQAFTRNLRKRRLPMLPVMTRKGILHPRKVLKASKLTELWRRRQISNFQYIMELNVIAGRSYNDISQYPVFPWVLADYTSTELNLDNPASFRDLGKPMGAQNERRRQLFLERYASFEDETVPKFMYGTHYSSAGVVLHYLVRQDPFTTLHINLQGGRFDCPDRLFADLGQSWKGCTDESTMSDVKELTPEFFYCPDMFLNANKLPLGEMQGEKGAVDDVELPPWAKDAFDFVRIHRLALESEQVSRHLHRWIDLVFGYQQRGDEAVKAANVFYYLTYEGAVDLSLVNDDRQREAMEAQIRHFGQTPSQVLKEPHPIRLPPEECVLPIFSPTSTLASLRVFSAGNRPHDPGRGGALLVYCTKDRLVSVDAAIRVTTWTWSGVPDGFGLPFTLGPSVENSLSSRSLHMSNVSAQTSAPRGPVLVAPGRGRGETTCASTKGPSTSFGWNAAPWNSVAGASASGGGATPDVPARAIGRVHSCFGVCTAFHGGLESILSCGYWDSGIRLHRVNSAGKLPLDGSETGGHCGAITCLAIAQESSLLVTGGQDATCRVWVVGNAPMASALGGTSACGVISKKGTTSRDSMVCVHVLYGHEAPITCLAVSEELDTVVSGASDGRIVLHCLKNGCYVRQYRCGTGSAAAADAAETSIPEASQLAFSRHGDVVVHSWTDRSLHRYSLNGTRLATAVAPTTINCLLTAGGGEYLLA
ncbi:unnamed protein product, partial [Ectocarpus fasciculatus]